MLQWLRQPDIDPKSALLGPGRRRRILGILSSAVCISMLFSPAAFDCPYSIRDVGFVDLNSLPYRLYFFVKDDTAQKENVASAFKQASGVVLMDSNVEAEIVNVDQQKDHPAMEYLRFWEIETFPAAILLSPRGHSMEIQTIFDPKKPFKETVWPALEKVVASPRREEVMGRIVRAWCVVLLVEGKDSAENAKAKKMVADAIEDITRTMNQAGKTVEEAPHSIILSPDSFAEEEILLWSLGLEDYGSRGPRVALLYGRGRQFGPVLEGENLTQQNLFQVLSVIGMSCGCDFGLDPAIVALGTSIPHKWGRKLRAKVAKDLGFDPDNPMVKMEISGALAAHEGVGGAEEGIAEAFAYSEGEIVNWEKYRQLEECGIPPEAGPVRNHGHGAHAAPGAGGLTASSGTTLASVPENPSTLEKRIGRVVLFVVFGMALLVLGGGTFFFSRAGRRKASP